MKGPVNAAYRWSVLSRCLAAAIGGYAVVTLLHLALTAVLPVDSYKALLFSSQTGYLYYTGIIIWCFAVRSAPRAWLGIGFIALPLLLVDAAYLLHRGLP
jgi:hypothetical protein